MNVRWKHQHPSQYLTWSVATSHSIEAFRKAFSVYRTAAFFSLRSRSRVRVWTSAAALRLLTSPGNFDMNPAVLAHLWYCPCKKLRLYMQKIDYKLTEWRASKWRRKVVASLTMNFLSLTKMSFVSTSKWKAEVRNIRAEFAATIFLCLPIHRP